MTTFTVADVMQIIERLYPSNFSESWDKVGLIAGDLEAPVQRINIAVDPVTKTVQEALKDGADLLLTHHPLYLRPTSFVSTADPKGKLIHQLITGRCALANAHTNADSAKGGVADALAAITGLKETFPMIPNGEDPTVGLGRIGLLENPITLFDLAKRVAEGLPASPGGLLLGGPPKALVQKIAVSGGSGDSMLGLARQLEADVFLTADLRHHPALEHLEGGSPYLLCGTHWATEWLWCDQARVALLAAAHEIGIELEVKTSKIVTEPWSAHLTTNTLREEK